MMIAEVKRSDSNWAVGNMGFQKHAAMPLARRKCFVLLLLLVIVIDFARTIVAFQQQATIFLTTRTTKPCINRRSPINVRRELVGRGGEDQQGASFLETALETVTPLNGGTSNGGEDPEEEPDDDDSFPMFHIRDLESLLELLVPVMAPIIAFITYEYVAEAFSSFIDTFSQTNWYPVDGGNLQARVIAPAINGVIVPATSLLYATLASTTIGTLRQRQLDMKRAINLEAGELRNLAILIQTYPKSNVRDLCKAYLIKYTNRIVSECEPHVTTGDDVIDPRRGMETELNGFLMQVHRAYGDAIPAHLAEQTLGSIMRLREHRLVRVTALQSTYPALHYGTLVSKLVDWSIWGWPKETMVRPFIYSDG